jgi:hypothetical protein
MSALRRPRSCALGLAALTLSGGLAACGASDSDKIKDAVKSYIQAVLDDDGRTACGLLTPQAASAFVDKVKATTKTTDCATAFRQEAGTLQDSEKAVYRSAVLGGITIKNDAATVTVKFTGVDKDISLRKIGSDWRIDTGPS